MENAIQKDGITLCPGLNLSAHILRIDRGEADADFCLEVSKGSREIHAVCCGKKIVGAALVHEDEDAYLYVYIFPEDRSRGYGYRAVCAAAAYLRDRGCRSLAAAYHEKNDAARALVKKCGFVPRSSTVVMCYSGEKFDLPPAEIRRYEDRDFLEAYTLSAEAFHRMRVETGHRPDSVPYVPDEEDRKDCLATADERYVYLLDGEIVGCAHIDGAEIDNVAIKIQHQGKGLGKILVKYLVNQIMDQQIGEPFLYCLAINQKAMKLYTSLGFRETVRNVYAVKQLVHPA